MHSWRLGTGAAKHFAVHFCPCLVNQPHPRVTFKKRSDFPSGLHGKEFRVPPEDSNDCLCSEIRCAKGARAENIHWLCQWVLHTPPSPALISHVAAQPFLPTAGKRREEGKGCIFSFILITQFIVPSRKDLGARLMLNTIPFCISV